MKRKRNSIEGSQPMLFSVDADDRVCIEDAASELGVSTATVRNWLKTGYLRADRVGSILRDSIQEFQTTVAGVEKLNKRANKSLLDSHNHTDFQNAISAELSSKSFDSSDTLS